MEVNKFNELYSKICQKFSFSEIDKDNNKQISQEEVLYLASQDEELRAELGASDLELIEECISIEKALKTNKISDDKNISNAKQISTPSKRNLKTMDEYMQMMDEKYADLFSKLDSMNWQTALHEMMDSKYDYLGSSSASTCKASEYFDADGDGRITEIDQLLWSNYLYNYNNKFDDARANRSTKANYTGLGRALSCIVGQIKNVTTANTYGTSYDLDDLEQIQYLIETSNYKGNNGLHTTFHVPHVKFNVNSIAQDDNWEEKLDKYLSASGCLSLTKDKIKQLKDSIITAREYLKNNTKNKQYANMASAYNIYKQNLATLDKFVKPISENAKQKFGYDDTEAANYDNGHRINHLLKDCLLYVSDINGDGTINFNDINSFPEEIDLDGDGIISKEEKEFIKLLKPYLYSKTSINTFNVEDEAENVINYLNVKENNSFVEFFEKDYIKTCEEFADECGIKNFKERYFTDDGLLITNRIPPEGKMTTADWKFILYALSSDSYGKYGTMNNNGVCDSSNLIKNLKYKIDNNELSKSKLTEILNKINSSSASVQLQLSEVKSAVQKKLEAIE